TVNATGFIGSSPLSCSATVAFTAAVTPLTLSLVSGDRQSGTVGVPLPAPFVVSVTNGAPVEGATVTWAVSQGNGILSSTQTITDSKGQAQIILTPSSTGTITVTAQASFTSARSNIFTFTEIGRASRREAVVTGDGEAGAGSGAQAAPVGGWISDRAPADGATVTWAVSQGNGTVSSTQTITDSKGQAQIILPPSSTGTITVTAQASFTSARSNIFTFT